MRRPKASCCVRAIGGGVRRPAGPIKPATVPVRPGAGEPSSPFLVSCPQYMPAPSSGACSNCGLPESTHRSA